MPVTPGPTRDRRIDSLRGLLVVLMAITATGADLHLATGRALDFGGVAEGFLFVSGLVAGWIYAHRMLERGFASACAASARRAATVYRTHLLMYFAAFAWALLFTLAGGGVPSHLPSWFVAEPFNALWLGVSLLQQPGHLDVLPLVGVLLLVVPWVVRATLRGNGLVVFALSFLAWAMTQSVSGGIVAWEGRIALGAMHPLAWQFPFLAGAVLGAHRATGARLLEPRAGALALAAVAAVPLWLVSHGIVRAPLPADQLAPLTNSATLGALRLVNFALLAYFVAHAAVVFPRAFQWRPLAIVGASALPVFAAQSLVGIVLLSYPALFATTALGRILGLTAILATVCGVAAINHWRRTRRIEAAIARLLRAPAPKPPPSGLAQASPR